MSLFQARRWWETSARKGQDAYDYGSLCVARLRGQTIIITGSFAGVLRIYQPQHDDFQADDLLLDKTLDQGIIQIERLSKLEDDIPQLLFLHPKKISSYKLSVSEETGMKFHKVFEHSFSRSAANVVHGNFGGNESLSICVQSMDGALSFYNQDGLAFSRYLPSFLLPGPLCYVPPTDSFVTANAACYIESYKYLTLASAAQNDDKAEAGKRVQAQWSYNTGEHALQIAFAPAAHVAIVVLGEQSLFTFSGAGVLRMCKRFESYPSCVRPYRVVDEKLNVLLAYHDKTVAVLEDTTIKWVSQFGVVPVAMRVAKFRDVEGMIVTLDDDGALAISYLGTDPSMPVSAPTAARNLNYDELDKEMAELQQKIRSAVVGAEQDDVDGILRFIVAEPQMQTGGRSNQEYPLYFSAQVVYSGKEPLRELVVQFSASSPIIVENNHVQIPTLGGNGPSSAAVDFNVGLIPYAVPSTTRCHISASYKTSSGHPRTVEEIVVLPLSFFCTRCSPSKSPPCKLTIITNQPSTDLFKLFEDITGGVRDENEKSSVGFALNGDGPEVTLLVSKSAGKYRLQGAAMDGFALIAQVLIERLEQLFKNASPPLQVKFSDGMPLREYFEMVDTHYQVRADHHLTKEQLEHTSQQFRIIQKRLLTRFKDKTPSPLQHLDTLLDGAYHQMDALLEAAEGQQRTLTVLSSRLSCGTRLLLLLLRLRYDLPGDLMEELENAFAPDFSDTAELGWEECVLASLVHLLRTKLSIAGKNLAGTPELSLPDDSARLKKNIALVCERVAAFSPSASSDA